MTDELNYSESGVRILHTMLRVRDLDTSIDFYTRLLGMNLLRRTDYPAGRFTLAFVGYGDEARDSMIELTHNWDQEKAYELGSAYGHIAIAVPDLYGACARLKKEGVSVPRPPGPMKGGTTALAFIEDPDGYRVELLEV